ncbi:rhodanese-like domain-containing protein [Rheinheimera sp. 4Y26]|uniref:rhodanese-like domain-containing protein n=1 Tax=Rheinheimera sp. 4Y26 TaxID=2977811 RepID=UPI0021B1588E|nr:rhodanese-like domain-containing protein [Rheinheimera sp. 4Y26]MCT6700180.1 rhodanese-like domain-containing protein [Rheinheimera sp. 4Y26]
MKNAQQLVAEAKSQIREVSVEQLAAALNDPHSILIDVREPDEFNVGHIHSAVNYPRGVLEMRIHQHPAVAAICDTDQALATLAGKAVYLLCRSGARSALAAVSLQQMGFSRVYSVTGGFQAWQDAGLKVEI